MTSNLVSYLLSTCYQSFCSIFDSSLPKFAQKHIIDSNTWSKLRAVDSDIPKVPSHLQKAYDTEDCPYWPGHKVKQTSLLVLVPGKINGEPMSPRSLKEKVEETLGISTIKDPHFFKSFGDQSIESSYWAIITVNPIPNTTDIKYSDQERMLKPGYRRPTIMELVTLFSGARLNGDNVQHGLFSRCVENQDFAITSTGSDLIEIEYYNRSSGTFAVRT